MKNFLVTSILLNVSALVAGVPTSTADESTVLNLEARSNSFVGEYYCGLFANADSSDANSLIQSLGGDNKSKKYSIGAHGCYRVACHNTSGVFVCNVSHVQDIPPPNPSSIPSSSFFPYRPHVRGAK